MKNEYSLPDDDFPSEELPFLNSQPQNSSTAHRPQSWPGSFQGPRQGAVFLHLFLIMLYTVTSITIILSFHEPASQRRHNILNDLYVQFKSHQYPLMRESPYIGAPNAKVEEEWHRLFSSISLRVTASELSMHRQSSVALPNGGYLAWLGVYHELHCVKVLRQINYREHYHPNLTVQALRDLQVHADHCIDQLRSAVMCHGDTESLTTFVWDERWEKPLLSPQRPIHRCMDWEGLVQSIQYRVVSEGELDRMKRPV